MVHLLMRAVTCWQAPAQPSVPGVLISLSCVFVNNACLNCSRPVTTSKSLKVLFRLEILMHLKNFPQFLLLKEGSDICYVSHLSSCVPGLPQGAGVCPCMRCWVPWTGVFRKNCFTLWQLLVWLFPTGQGPGLCCD